MTRSLRIRNTQTGAVEPLSLEIDNGDGTFATLGMATAGEAAAGVNANKVLTPSVAVSGVTLTRVSLANAVTDLTTAFGGTVDFDTEETDENSAWSLAAPNKFVIPASGNWRVQFSAYAQIDAGTDVVFELQLTRDGNTEVASDYLSSDAIVAYKFLTATFTRYLPASSEIYFNYGFASGTGPNARLFAGAFATLEKLK